MLATGEQPAETAHIPVIATDALRWLTVEQMREVDRVMIEELQITLVRMMENAGSCLAETARLLLGGSARGEQVVVLAGSRGNGGGGLVAARHLSDAGAHVEVRLSVPREGFAPVPRERLEILARIGVMSTTGQPFTEAPDLAVDALLGYSQRGDPRGDAPELIAWTAGRRVLALDTPSGVELATGQVRFPAVYAEATMTLALPKDGLRTSGAAAHVGDLYLTDISVPPLVYEQLQLSYDTPFTASRIVRVVMPAAITEPDARGRETTPAT